METAVTESKDFTPEQFRFLFTMAIGLGFATTALTWTHYNGEMIGFIETHFQDRYSWLTSTFIGFIMTWDNIIAIFLQPWIGARSDNTKTRFGKRTPYILVGIPLAAIFFALIPLMKAQSIIFLVLVILAFNMSMAIYRSPVVSLMPDLTHPKHRTKGNGVINLMGGVAAGVALLVGGSIVAGGNIELSFAVMSILMIVSMVAFLLLVKEPEEIQKIKDSGEEWDDSLKEGKPKVVIVDEVKQLFRTADKSKLFILLAIASWFIAWNAMEVWLPPYIATVILGEDKNVDEDAYLEAIGEANAAIFLVPVIFVLMTLPGGYLGYKYGRRPIIRIGLLMFIFAMIFGYYQTEMNMVAVAFMIAGAAWGLINVNSIVIVWELSKDNIGAGTGLYYLASSFAAIVGPITFGTMLDITDDYKLLWGYAVTFLAIAFFIMFKVTSGELGDSGDHKALDALGELD
ncbi:MAG: MFS transporter [Candidatus Kariarchaeaceae archaeon]|jgi:MFS family permease